MIGRERSASAGEQSDSRARSMRIVVTGLGAVTPFGVGVSSFWSKVTAGASAVRAMPEEAYRKWSPVAAPVDFDPAQYLPRKTVADTDRCTQLALIAAAEAMTDAGFQPEDELHPFGTVERERVGIAFGTAFGGVRSLDAGSRKLAAGSDKTSPRLVSKSIPNAAAGAMAIRWGIQGPVITYATACASSANSVGEALYWLRSGAADIVLAGGAESLYAPPILAGLNAAGAVAKSGPDDVSRWSRPFDRDRQGMIMGEGAAMLVLEPLDRARARGARIYAELTGYGTSNDAYHETAPHPQGQGAALAMSRALRSAGLTPGDIGYVNAHATSTPAGDEAEGRALRAVFGGSLASVPVSSIKGAVGHLLGAAGAVESVASILAIHTGVLPPTLHCEHPDDSAPPDLIPGEARRRNVRHVLSNSFGFGGQNAALIWSRQEEG